MSSRELEEKLKSGITAARSGNRSTARRLLEEVIAQDPNNELAWIWMASVVDSTSERRICLERVLEINPRNARAREALQRMSQEAGAGPAPAGRSPSGGGGGGSNALLIGLGIVAVVIVALLALNFSQPAVVEITVTPSLSVAQLRQTPSPTPSRTPTPPIVIVSPVPATLPPTFTPTATEVASETPPPTFTPFPLDLYTFFYTARDPDQVLPALYEIKADGSGERFLLSNADEVAFDPVGEQFAFVRQVAEAPPAPAAEATEEAGVPISAPGGQFEIFSSYYSEPEAVVQLTNTGIASVHSPQISPDGRQMVFVSDFDGDEELWIYDFASQTPTQITFNNAVDRDPRWSPDGRFIAFASDRETPGFLRIYVLNMDLDQFIIDEEGRAIPPATRLTSDQGSSYAPDWSPDGTQIAYINDRDGFGALFVMLSDGQRKRQLISGTTFEQRQPTWTGDARYVAFLSNREGGRFQLYMIDVETREIVRITDGTRDVTSASARPALLLRLRLRQ